MNLDVLLDASDSMAWGNPDKFSYARRVAIGLAYVALSHMDTATLIALRGDHYLQLSRQESATATARLVNSASGLIPSGPTDLDASLGAYATLGSQRGVVVLLSDLLSPSGYRDGLERLSGVALRPTGKCVGRDVGKSASHVPETRCRARMGEVSNPMLSRKTSSELCAARTPNRLR